MEKGKQRRPKFPFRWHLLLLFNLEIVLFKAVAEMNDGEAALLKELSGTHLFLAASPVHIYNTVF